MAGRIGLGAFWQSSVAPPATSFGTHSALAFEAPFFSARVLACSLVCLVCSGVGLPVVSWADASGANVTSPTASRVLARIARVRNRTGGLLSRR